MNHMSMAYSKSAAARNPMLDRTQMSMAVIVSASGMLDLSELPMLTSMRKMVTRRDILEFESSVSSLEHGSSIFR